MVTNEAIKKDSLYGFLKRVQHWLKLKKNKEIFFNSKEQKSKDERKMKHTLNQFFLQIFFLLQKQPDSLLETISSHNEKQEFYLTNHLLHRSRNVGIHRKKGLETNVVRLVYISFKRPT